MKSLTKLEIFNSLKNIFDNFEYKKLSTIPHPNSFKDIDRASKRVFKAIQNQEKIVIIGDYDVDGVVSTTMLKEFFNYLDYKVEYVIPNRFSDGYGLSVDIINRIDANVIITVDNGITAVDSASLCIEKGIDLIITDHHSAPEVLPQAYAIINPKQEDCNFPFIEICGAQVVWYFIAHLKKEFNLDLDMSSFFDILIIAIIADVMPIISLNHTMVKVGLKKFNSSNRASILAIKDSLNSSLITSEDIAFMVAPKLNSAGRLESAVLAVEFLLSDNLESAKIKLDYLHKLNQDRKIIEQEITDYAKNEVDTQGSIILVYGDGWNEGVIGIVASRLVDMYLKPAIVISINNDIAKASCRSLDDINIYDILNSHRELFIKFGGHKLAAGFSMYTKDILKLKSLINLNRVEVDKSKLFYDKAFCMLNFYEIDFDLVNIVSSFEPYGFCNEKPLFLSKNVVVVDFKLIGVDKNHIKLKLTDSKKIKVLDAIIFNCATIIKINSIIDIIYTVSINEFRNSKNLQLMIKDFKLGEL